MGINDLKLHTVIVGGGSGVLFQPPTRDYTYILTAKHIFFDEIDNGRGEEKIEKKDGEIVDIYQLTTDGNDWFSDLIQFSIQKNKNYFPHNEVDIAILKIDYRPGLEKLILEENIGIVTDYLICGFPNKLRVNTIVSEKYTNHRLERIISDNTTSVRAQLSIGTLIQSDIVGMSGCGVLKVENENISLIGIQSKVPTNISNGQIDFVPIKFFNEIASENGLLSLSIDSVEIDDFSNINRDWKLHDNVFSVTYNSKSEPHYLRRAVDQTLINYLNRNKNVWISGISGIGKTFLILGNLNYINDNPIRIDLTCSKLDNIDDYFEYINTEIIQQSKLEKLSNKGNVYEKISDNLCEINLQSNQILIFVDEVPILEKEKFYAFLTGFINISERYSNLIEGSKNINWIISTRINPEDHLNNQEDCLPNQQKARKNFNFKNLDLWNEDELSNLLKILQISLNFTLSNQTTNEIISNSKGLPGLAKSVIERFLLENCTIHEAIEIIKSENILL
jgi:hypothetical protein